MKFRGLHRLVISTITKIALIHDINVVCCLNPTFRWLTSHHSRLDLPCVNMFEMDGWNHPNHINLVIPNHIPIKYE